MNPKHQQVLGDHEAHAPYNFVPLPEEIVKVEVDSIPSLDRYIGYTGSIACTLTTRTPLYIRCGMTPDIFKRDGEKAFHELSDAQKAERARFFFGADPDKPLIPGSSLRGMLRNLVEIAGYGKQQWVTDELMLYRAVGDPTSLGEFYRRQVLGPNKTPAARDTHVDYPTRNLRAGYLAQTSEGWGIRPAVTHLSEYFVHVEYTAANVITHGYGHQALYNVYVTPAPRVTLNRGLRGNGDLILDVAIAPSIMPRGVPPGAVPSGMVPGVLVESGHMGGPHPKHWHCVIYEADTAATLIKIPQEMWRIYEEDRDLTRGSKTPTRKLTADGDPLFYLVDSKGELVFFGPTMMFRLPYPHTPLNGFVPQNLRNNFDLDLAEAIFGYTKGDEIPEGERAHAGRVAITDAVFEKAERDIWLSPTPITPKVLGTPKPTSFQLYLTQQEPNDRRRLDHYASPPPHRTVIRGHKLYWHQADTATDDIEERDQYKLTHSPKQYTQIKPVARGVSFTFTIYFENLRDFELGALLWAVKLPGTAGGTYCHKLGMGKPLGLGSVQVTEKLDLSHRYASEGEDLKSRYALAFCDTGWHQPETQSADSQPFLAAFENFVLTRMHQGERAKAEHLHDMPRIKMLLAMLSWPGPNHVKTRYMTVEPDNQYRDRRVLPDPLAVLAGQSVQPPIPMHQPTGKSHQPPGVQAAPVAAPQPQAPHRPQGTSAVGPAPTPPGPSPKPLSQPQPKPIREATVVKPEGSFITVEFEGEQVNISLEYLADPGRDLKERQRLYPPGSKIRVHDLGVSGKGKRRLTTKGV